MRQKTTPIVLLYNKNSISSEIPQKFHSNLLSFSIKVLNAGCKLIIKQTYKNKQKRKNETTKTILLPSANQISKLNSNQLYYISLLKVVQQRQQQKKIKAFITDLWKCLPYNLGRNVTIYEASQFDHLRNSLSI